MENTIGSLFAGIGGICHGFKNVGFEVLWANEIDKKACETYRLNLPSTKTQLLETNVLDISFEELPKVDVITAGFPCQPFSIAGSRKGLQDKTRGSSLFDALIYCLTEKKPKSFLLENVRNIKNVNSGKDFKKIILELKKTGYDVYYKVLSSYEYGNVPQARERMFFVGFRKNLNITNFTFPEPIPLCKTPSDFIDRTKRVEEKYYYKTTHKYYKVLSKEVIDDAIYQWRRVYVRRNARSLCPTLTANMGGGGHNVPIIRDNFGIRKLTPRECIRFQGYPEDFLFPEKMCDTALYKQIGNSVVISVIERIAKEMQRCLKSK